MICAAVEVQNGPCHDKFAAETAKKSEESVLHAVSSSNEEGPRPMCGNSCNRLSKFAVPNPMFGSTPPATWFWCKWPAGSFCATIAEAKSSPGWQRRTTRSAGFLSFGTAHIEGHFDVSGAGEGEHVYFDLNQIQ